MDCLRVPEGRVGSTALHTPWETLMEIMQKDVLKLSGSYNISIYCLLYLLIVTTLIDTLSYIPE